MEITSLFHLFIENLMATGLLEYVAVFTGLLSVWYARKENILVYPVGIVSVLLYVYLCYFAGLYADMGINAFYFIMSIYGWYKWTRKDKVKHTPRQISWCSKTETISGISAVVLFTGVLFLLLKHFTNSTVPFIDSFTTSVFIVGMWLMALKRIENWVYWIIGDVICIVLFPYKGLVFSGFQYLVFLALAVMGFIEWRNKLLNSELK